VSRSIAILSFLFLSSRAAAMTGEVCAPPLSEALLETPAATGALELRPVAPSLVEHGARDLPLVALTFDACTTRDKSPYDERITRILQATRTPATIFVGGGWAQREAGQLSALAADPLFELGNHSFTHPHMADRTDEAVADELMRTQAEVLAVTGRVPTLFRPPFGEYDEHLVRVAARLGLTTVEYDLASGDPDANFTKERLIASVLGRVKRGAIVVMHINHQRFHTAEALPEIIATLRARGFELVTVSELLRRQHAEEIALGEARSCRTPSPQMLAAPLLPSPEELSDPRQELPLREVDGRGALELALPATDSFEKRRRRG
jgi:peptidoglycan/xylan/chitin deacetylase (PgdA/CDA1 family)